MDNTKLPLNDEGGHSNSLASNWYSSNNKMVMNFFVRTAFWRGSKGQLNLEWINEVIVSPKMQTKK